MICSLLRFYILEKMAANIRLHLFRIVLSQKRVQYLICNRAAVPAGLCGK